VVIIEGFNCGVPFVVEHVLEGGCGRRSSVWNRLSGRRTSEIW
jgi:hypothetical protein